MDVAQKKIGNPQPRHCHWNSYDFHCITLVFISVAVISPQHLASLPLQFCSYCGVPNAVVISVL